MTKINFILSLNEKLSGLPKEEIEERLSFYSEMIEDRMEEGFSEEEAVAAVGDVEEIAEQIIKEVPLVKIAKEKIKTQRSFKAWEIVLLVIGSPVWLAVLISVLAVIFSVYVSLWSVIVSLWAVFASFIGCAIGGLISGIAFLLAGKEFSGIALLAGAIIFSGISIIFFFLCKLATNGILLFTKRIALLIKKCFLKKEEK